MSAHWFSVRAQAKHEESKEAPKTLDETILISICMGPIGKTQERLYQNIRSFLAERFGAAMLDDTITLETLFNEIVKREEMK